MTNQTESSTPFDFLKGMTQLDPSKLMEEFTNTLKQYQLPGVDVEAVLDTQRKNVEALTSANKTAIEGVQAVVARQGEILKETLEEVTESLKDVAAAGSPSEAATKQGELLKHAIEKAVANMRELAEMTSKANTDAFEIVKKRVSENVGEIKKLAEGLKK